MIDPNGWELLVSVGAAAFTLRLAVAVHGRTPPLDLAPGDAPGVAARVLRGWPITAPARAAHSYRPALIPPAGPPVPSSSAGG